MPAPGTGPGFWAGASSAALDAGGSVVIAYRVRTPDRRGSSVALATWAGGDSVAVIGSFEKERFGAESLERPALVHANGAWRLYVSCATPGTKHWRIDVLASGDPAGLLDALPATVFPGSDAVAVKDPVVRRGPAGWEAWICCHPLDEPGEEDRMATACATSPDGFNWSWYGTVLAGRPGRWDARGARVTSVLPDGRFTYDGRASKEENFSERTGLARRASGGRLEQVGDRPVAAARYVDVAGDHVFFEQPLEDGSHELRVAPLL